MAAPIWQFVNGVLNGPTISVQSVLVDDGSEAAPSVAFASDPDTGWYLGGADDVRWAIGGAQSMGLNSSFGLRVNVLSLDFANADVKLVRDFADTLALRNGTNAQTFRVYNTYTSASVYEAGTMMWQSNILSIGTTTVGATARALRFMTGGTDRWQVGATDGHLLALADNTYDIGAAGANRPRSLYLGSFISGQEMTAPAAPPANGYRIFAQDNGAGKTQLMVIFASGAAQQIAIEP